MTRLQVGAVVWSLAGVFVLAGLELPAHFGVAPWPTLSTELRDGVQAWRPLAECLVALAVLFLLHIIGGLSWIPLAIVGAATVAGLLVHFLT